MSLVAHDCYIDEYGEEGNEVQGSNRSVGQAKAKVNHQYVYLSARSVCYRTAPESFPRISVHTKDSSRQKVLDRPKRLPWNSQNIANREWDVQSCAKKTPRHGRIAEPRNALKLSLALKKCQSTPGKTMVGGFIR